VHACRHVDDAEDTFDANGAPRPSVYTDLDVPDVNCTPPHSSPSARHTSLAGAKSVYTWSGMLALKAVPGTDRKREQPRVELEAASAAQSRASDFHQKASENWSVVLGGTAVHWI
jgi:hypothetical protein